MNVVESAMTIPCHGVDLVAVLSRPQTGARDLGVVIVVGGPQYRAGSHRMFVALARGFAARGYPTLRFDVRGMGDSGGDPVGFEDLDDDLGAAIDALFGQVGGLRGVVLWGLCDGASAASIYMGRRHDERVVGLCAVNPWVRSTTSHAQTQVRHYYVDRLRQRDFWSKLLRGGIGPGALAGFLRKLRGAYGGAERQADSFQDRMCSGWLDCAAPKLLLMSAEDYTAREFDEYVRRDSRWRTAVAQPNVERVDIASADHTFSSANHLAAAESASLQWISSLRA